MNMIYSKDLPIKKILKKVFQISDKKCIKSIILVGSGATNELTRDPDKSDFLISDIEIAVFYKYFTDYIFKKRRIKIKIDNYSVDISFTHILSQKFLKTPLIYTLKVYGIILWGKDIKKAIWIDDFKKIPHWEAVRLIYNRLIPFLMSIWKYKKNLKISRYEEYNHIKLLIAIGEYFMIKNGNFRCTYKDKLIFLEQNFKNINKIIQILDALKYKLNLIKDFNSKKNIDFTILLTFNILKKIELNFFKIPLSFKIFNFCKKIKNREYQHLFSNYEIIKIYQKSYQLLILYLKDQKKFLEYGNEIKNLNNRWYHSSEQILSSYI